MSDLARRATGNSTSGQWPRRAFRTRRWLGWYISHGFRVDSAALAHPFMSPWMLTRSAFFS
jgi:hypothetical protein